LLLTQILGAGKHAKVREHLAARAHVEGLRLFVSRGLGAAEIPVRLGAPPDILLITLTADP